MYFTKTGKDFSVYMCALIICVIRGVSGKQKFEYTLNWDVYNNVGLGVVSQYPKNVIDSVYDRLQEAIDHKDKITSCSAGCRIGARIIWSTYIFIKCEFYCLYYINH